MERAYREPPKRLPRNRLDAGMKGWIVNTAKQNMWRMPSWVGLDDLIQDGLECVWLCQQKYWDVETPAHFMSLVQTTFIRHITDLANAKTRTKAGLEYYQDSPEFLTVQPEEATFRVMINQLPSAFEVLVKRLLDDEPMIQYEDGTRETNNEYLCRLLGIEPSVRLLTVFKEHFGIHRKVA